MTSRAVSPHQLAATSDEGAFLIFRPLVNPSDADRASVAGRGCAQERSRPVYRVETHLGAAV